jgi:hypothetical protein
MVSIHVISIGAAYDFFVIGESSFKVLRNTNYYYNLPNKKE